MHWTVALGVTLAIQLASALLNASIMVSAPLITAAAGVPVDRIGYYSSLQTVGTMWFLMSGAALIKRFGPLRMLQVGLVLSALAITMIMSAWWPLILLAGLISGIGYGPLPPSSGEILARYAPANRRGLVFSVKQAGVPVGQALGGLIVPAIALAIDWRAGIGAAILFLVVTMVTTQKWRREIDADRDRKARVALADMLSLRHFAAPVRGLRLAPALPGITFAGFGFAMSQTCFFSFFVPYLTADLLLGVAAAGFAYAVLQVCGAVGRVGAGWWADRRSGRVTLAWLSAGATAALIVTAALGQGTPWPLLLAASAFVGLTAVSWNGVYLSEIATIVPREKVGEATAASSFFSFIGYALGPAIFSAIVQLSGSYRLAFLTIAALPALSCLVLLRQMRKRV